VKKSSPNPVAFYITAVMNRYDKTGPVIRKNIYIEEND
jgi:hypothetical protein